MNANVIFDDSLPVSDQARQLAGLSAYGDLLFRGQRHVERFEAAARGAGWTEFLRVRDARDAEAALAALRREGGPRPCLYVPASLAWSGDPAELESLLKNLLLAGLNVQIAAAGASLICADADTLAGLLPSLGHHRGDAQAALLAALPFARTPPELVNLAGAPAFVEYLTGSFAVRHFNAIENERYVVRKVSTDRAKLKREFDYFSYLPPAMRMYFVNAFDFEDDGTSASYRMERVFAPDVAIQWVHGSLGRAAFGNLLDRLMHYLTMRAHRKVPDAEGRRVAEEIYLTKVVDRLQSLRGHAGFARFDVMLRQFPGLHEGIDGLEARYRRLFRSLGGKRGFERLEMGHGDLCMSNILYAPDTELMKFIDVRGATGEDDMYGDRMYDVAKLSHSILGRYDYINNGVYRLDLDDDAGLRLTIAERDQAEMKALFVARLEQAGYDVRLLRLYEASLFLSMLPLHMDRPRNVLAFAATAAGILDWIEAN